MSEKPAPGYVTRQKQIVKKEITTSDLPPLKNRDGDWPPPSRFYYPKFPLYDDGCSARCQCVRPSAQLGDNARHTGQMCCAKDPRELPYGLPRISYDVRRRSDWLGNWSEQMARYSGSFALWNQDFGDLYYYTNNACEASKKRNNN
ncbi:hypothetical protein RRG08_050237 [Elysia crispata]|uniref:Uncharacterized protein n=1 Tax=Elysia crispata TaxID=231223 RepID=A0AAE1B3I9_9GAST|nr:hypothetical protein RRG08_050237 [Elysia crispata]